MADLAVAIADRVYVYDNSEDGVDARLCLRTHEGLVRKVYGPLPEWVNEATAQLPRHIDFVDLRAAS
jgi:hypothetical protein